MAKDVRFKIKFDTSDAKRGTEEMKRDLEKTKQAADRVGQSLNKGVSSASRQAAGGGGGGGGVGGLGTAAIAAAIIGSVAVAAPIIGTKMEESGNPLVAGAGAAVTGLADKLQTAAGTLGVASQVQSEFGQAAAAGLNVSSEVIDNRISELLRRQERQNAFDRRVRARIFSVRTAEELVGMAVGK